MQHPYESTLYVVRQKADVLARTENLQEKFPEWSHGYAKSKAEWDYFYSKWKVRFVASLPYAVIGALGALSLLGDSIIYEPILALILSEWTDLILWFVNLVSFGFFEWIGFEFPRPLANYLSIGIGVTGIHFRFMNDLSIISKMSATDSTISHMGYSNGCVSLFLTFLHMPVYAPIWPLFPVAQIGQIYWGLFSGSIAKRWSLTRRALLEVQLKRLLMYSEPLLVAIFIYISSELLSKFL